LNQTNSKKEYTQGIACAILCAVLWGLLPVYWKTLDDVNPLLIMLYRIVLAFLFALVLALKVYKWEGIKKPLKEKGILKTFFLTGVLISTNWGIYIWAVSTDHIIQTCIGYYIEPLIVCIFGILLFHEKLNLYKLTALLLAGLGVLVMLIYYGEIPIIALSLAISFASYAAIKKKYKLDAVLALLYETMLLVPVALVIILYIELSGKGAFSTAEPYQLTLLALAGIVTGTPLMLFAMAANRINLVTLGITEYVSPSLTLLLGIFVYREPFDTIQLITFSIIWAGLIIFTVGEWKEGTENKANTELKENREMKERKERADEQA
jgi:chloramphenicol-sensitive protein RarD